MNINSSDHEKITGTLYIHVKKKEEECQQKKNFNLNDVFLLLFFPS